MVRLTSQIPKALNSPTVEMVDGPLATYVTYVRLRG